MMKDANRIALGGNLIGFFTILAVPVINGGIASIRKKSPHEIKIDVNESMRFNAVKAIRT